MKRHPIRDTKGFLFETADVARPMICRDVRGFPEAMDAAEDRAAPKPERLVVIVPDIAMQDWLGAWSEDDRHPMRKLTITRRKDGQQVRLTATLCSYGYGVETSVRVHRIEHEERTGTVPAAANADEEVKSGVTEVRGAGARKRAVLRAATG